MTTSCLTLTSQATTDNARRMRLRFQEWLQALGAAPPVVNDLTLAVYEALANVAEHAYPPYHPHPVMHLEVHLDHDHLLITVTDHGCWRTPRANSSRGYGLAMMRCLTELTLRTTTGGTTVRMRAALHPGDGHVSPKPNGHHNCSNHVHED
jgi:serine/threonine-protein kinase RsbW